MLAIIMMIVCGVFVPFAIWLAVAGFRAYAKNDLDGWGRIAFGMVGTIVAICVLIFFPSCQYTTNLTLVYRLPAIERTIEEQMALIENGDIGSGLEGMQMKQKIQDLLLKKNELLATYEERQVSLWWFLKPQWIEE